MTVMTRPAGAFPAVASGTPQLGEDITWTCSGVAVRHLDLVEALTASGLDPSVARALKDRDGRTMDEVLRSAGRDPDDLGRDDEVLSAVGTFVELHVEQGRDLVYRERAVAVGSEIWPHGRYRFDITGAANHAGTTRMEDRHDPMLTYAMTALAANKQARLADARATFGRVQVEPNGTNAVPSFVTAWLDARADTSEALEGLVAGITRQATERAERDGTTLATCEVWLDRASTGRLLVELSRRSAGAPPPTPEQQRIATLTLREREIIAVMAAHAGATAKAIAQKLHISEHTLRNHLTSIYEKLDVANRLELFAFAHQHDLTRGPG